MLNDSSAALVTGGAGFIGSNFVLDGLEQVGSQGINFRETQRRAIIQFAAESHVEWYLANQDWVEQVTSGAYQEWIDRNYAMRGEAIP